MDLPTYTNIWRIEKRLYKLYDFRLPAPLPINWIAVFAGITIPYIVLLVAIGLPFNHTLVWLYVLPPGVLTWLTTRPVIENKRLPELLESQVRYLTEPRVWTRLAPLSEKDQIVVTAKVWHSRRAPQRRKAALGTVALREKGTLARRGRGTAVPAPVEELVPASAAAAAAAPPRAKSRTRVRGTGPQIPVAGPAAGQRSSGRQPRAGQQAQPPPRTRSSRQDTQRAATARQTPAPAPAPASPEPPVAKRALEKAKQAPGAKPGKFRLAALRSRPAGPAPELPPGVALKPPAGSGPHPVQADLQFGDPSGVWPGQAIGARPGPANGDPGRPRSSLSRNGQAGYPPVRDAEVAQPGLARPEPVWPKQALSLRRVAPSISPAAAPVLSDMPAHATPDVHPAVPAPVVPDAPAPQAEPVTPVTPRPAAADAAVQEQEAAREASTPAEAAGPAAPPVRVRGSGAPPMEVAHSGHPRRPVPPAAVPPAGPAQPRSAPPRPVWPTQPATSAPPAPAPAAEPVEPEATSAAQAAESATPLVRSVEAPHPEVEAKPADLIAISGAIAPEIAIKAPRAPDGQAEQVTSVAGETPEPERVSPPESAAADLSPVSAAMATESEDKSQVPPSVEVSDSPVTEVAEAVQPPAPAQPAAVAEAPAEPQPVVHTVDGAQGRKVPSIERALSGPSKDRNLSWHGKVKIVTGTGVVQGPGARDQEALDRTRARLPLQEPKRILVLGCTSGAGQTVTTMMTGHILASLREHPVAAVDLHDGTLARYSAPAAWLEEILRGKAPRQHTPARADGLNPTPKPSPARLDIIASHDPLRDGDEVKLAVQFSRHYPLTMLDPGAAGLTRLLKITDQLVVVVPASVEGAGALSDTREWLDAHGFAELATHSVTLINGVSRRSLADVEHAESLARGRCRAIVRVPWDDMLPVGVTGPSTLRPQTRVAYTALAGVLVAGMAAAPVRTKP